MTNIEITMETARKVTIGVYENNQPAHQCYKAVGFREIKQVKFHTMNSRGKEWRVIELEITKDEYNLQNTLEND